MSVGGLRPRLAAVWLVLFVLVGAIVAIEHANVVRQTSGREGDGDPRMLLPVPVDQLGAIEVAKAGTLHRFERDPAGAWFYHGVHAGSEGAHAHSADPRFPPVASGELAGIDLELSLLGPLEQRRLLAARRAPARPEVEHDGTAAEARQRAVPAAVEEGQRAVGRRRRLTVRHGVVERPVVVPLDDAIDEQGDERDGCHDGDERDGAAPHDPSG